MNKIILIFLFVLSSSQVKCEEIKNLQIAPDLCQYDNIIDQITTKIENIIIERYHGKILVGDKRMVHWFDEPSLQFEVVGPLTKYNLRLMLIDIADEFLDLINKNIKNTINLKYSSYSLKDVSICVILFNNNHKWVYHPNILSASLDQSKLFFHTIDEKNIYEYKTTEIENYETALKIIESSKDDRTIFMKCYHFLFGG